MDAYQRLTEDLPARLPPGRSQRASEKAMREAAAGLPLANPAQALGVLVLLLAMLLIMNAGMSAIGAGIWVLVRRALPGMKPAPAADTDVF